MDKMHHAPCVDNLSFVYSRYAGDATTVDAYIQSIDVPAGHLHAHLDAAIPPAEGFSRASAFIS